MRASSTFLAASPALKPPLEMHIRCPSASSNLSSCDGHAQGQWCGTATHAVDGSASAVATPLACLGKRNEGKGTHLECLDRGNCRSGSAHTVRGRLTSRSAHSALAGGVAGVPRQRTSGRRSHHQTAPRQRSSGRAGAGQRGASCREFVNVSFRNSGYWPAGSLGVGGAKDIPSGSELLNQGCCSSRCIAGQIHSMLGWASPGLRLQMN